jgi:hypothetical protein
LSIQKSTGKNCVVVDSEISSQKLCIERRSKGRNAQDWQDEDPLDDIASHTPAKASGFLRGKTTRVEEEWVPNRTEEIPQAEMGKQERVGTTWYYSYDWLKA